MHLKGLNKIIAGIVIAIIILLMIWPFFYIFLSSFKPLKEIMSKATLLPKNPTLKNYKTLLFARTPVRDFPRFLYNSLVISSLTTICTIAIASISAYGISRNKRLKKGIISRFLLLLYVFPTVILLVPLYKIFAFLNLYDNFISLIIVYSALAAPFCTWLLTSFFDNIPRDIEESASIDGASSTSTFIRIVLPLAAPGLVAAGAYSFITAWGEYMFALVLISSNLKKTGPLGLATFAAEQYIEWGPLLAGSVLIMLPVFLIFLPISGYFIKGFTAGAVKE
ncbi:carbohydrate ABC transporter permease [Thermatribacter velox]|uniref:Carbohydrate ABC transporter permease n=1 Tax=Thermatribacter velox TaxID=3039681 RepID=A0ABZ2YCP8_9BACT